MTTEDRIVAVIGVTGQQGGGVVRALQSRGRFRVRALTRDPGRHAGLADEVVAADLDRPETLPAAFAGAYGAFVVTNFWQEGGSYEAAQGTAAAEAARDAGVEHFVWSTLPDVATISGGAFAVPHFTGKARVNEVVKGLGFPACTFVEAPFYYQNFTGVLAPQARDDGTRGWALPIDPAARCIHMGDIAELGNVVAGAFEHPDTVGQGQVLSLSGGLLSFDDVVATLNAQGHDVSFRQIPGEVFATFFPGAEEMVAMLGYFQAHTYLGPDTEAKIARANAVATAPPTDFATWARAHMPTEASADA